jgi:hypothetical protein
MGFGEGLDKNEGTYGSSWLRRPSLVPKVIPTSSPTTHANNDTSIDLGVVMIFVILGLAFVGIIFLIWRCQRRDYKGFKMLNVNASEDSDEEQPSIELAPAGGRAKGATIFEINAEEQKLMKRFESGKFNENEKDPLFGRMPESTNPPGVPHSDEILSRSEVVLNTSSVIRRDIKPASFDVGDASSNEVSRISEDTVDEATPPPKKRSVERLGYPDD